MCKCALGWQKWVATLKYKVGRISLAIRAKGTKLSPLSIISEYEYIEYDPMRRLTFTHLYITRNLIG